ncbi:TPA: glycosyltransferase family 2 protein [Streptococcus agalactiae]
MKTIKDWQINICLATYNGQKYLRQQLDSIIQQGYTDWICLIRDDGSTDDTVAIIKEYVNRDSRFIFINSNDDRKLGSHRSFYELVNYKKADFYVFSDQDDVWKENRLERYLEEAEKFNQELPLLVYSNWTSVDEKLTVLKEHNPATVIQEQIAFNQINGKVIMMNHELAKLWEYRQIGAHDSYVGTLAYAVGNVAYISDSTVLWRRQVGAESLNNYGRQYGVATFWQMINTSFDRASLIFAQVSDKMSLERKLFFSRFIELKNANLIRRIYLLSKLKLRRKSLKETVAMTILLLTGYGKPKA